MVSDPLYVEGRLGELKHLSNRGKEIKLEIAPVVASEKAKAQTCELAHRGCRTSISDCERVGERLGKVGHRR